jgi:hypothetical protein
MAAAMKKAKTIPDWPPMAPPIKTIRTVRRERRSVVLSLFTVFTSDDGAKRTWLFISGDNKKDHYPRHNCLDKGLVDRFLPRFRVLRP